MRTDTSDHARTKKGFYRPELDALRFFAFLLVFMHHDADSSGGPAITNLGNYGVDLFFLLSAYLITELFRREYGRTGGINIPAFYYRRILRIWPLYFCFLGCIIVAGFFIHRAAMPRAAALSFLLFYANWYMATRGLLSPAGPLWSISVEEQFYAVVPWAMRYLSQRGLLIAAAGVVALSATARVVLWNQGISAWFATITHLDPFAIGIAAALLLRGRAPTLSTLSRLALALAGLLLFWTAGQPLGGLDPRTLLDVSLSFPLSAIGSLLLFLAFLGARPPWRPIAYLGRISYGLYVFHLPILEVTKLALLHFLGVSPWLLRGAIAFPITIACAAISYTLLERPFLRLKRSGGSLAVTPQAAIALALADPFLAPPPPPAPPAISPKP
jgi:peptidoglycan/LPS O-acetylase OafA/YrhL